MGNREWGIGVARLSGFSRQWGSTEGGCRLLKIYRVILRAPIPDSPFPIPSGVVQYFTGKRPMLRKCGEFADEIARIGRR